MERVELKEANSGGAVGCCGARVGDGLRAEVAGGDFQIQAVTLCLLPEADGQVAGAGSEVEHAKGAGVTAREVADRLPKD